MKYVLVIGDGMADDPLPELGGKTPLEACDKPYFDSLCRRGVLGLVQTIPEGFPPGSDTAIMSIFGCDPAKYFSGRAPLELAASGGAMPEGGACYRCNMVTLGGDEGLPFAEKTMVSHSAGSIEGEESDGLVEWLFNNPEFAPLAEAAGMSVRPGSSFRHLAVQERADLAGIVLAPPHDHLTEKIGPILPRGNGNAKTLLALMEKANELLEHHPINEKRRAEGRLPANGIWFWAEGKGAKLPNFTERYGADGRRRERRAALPRDCRARGPRARQRGHGHGRMGYGLRGQDRRRARHPQGARLRRRASRGARRGDAQPRPRAQDILRRVPLRARGEAAVRGAEGSRARTSGFSFSPTTAPSCATGRTARRRCPS